MDRLAAAHPDGVLLARLRKPVRIMLVVMDKVGCILFEPQAPILFFPLASSRYERALLIVTRN